MPKQGRSKLMWLHSYRTGSTNKSRGLMTGFNIVPVVEKDTPALWKLKKKTFFKIIIWQRNVHFIYTDRSHKIKLKNSNCVPIDITSDTRLLPRHRCTTHLCHRTQICRENIFGNIMYQLSLALPALTSFHTFNQDKLAFQEKKTYPKQKIPWNI